MVKSLPDIGQLEPLAGILEVTVPELLHGRRQEKEMLTDEELKQWFIDCDEAMKESGTQQREKRKKRALFYGAVIILVAVEWFLLYLFRSRFGVSDSDLALDMSVIEELPLLFGICFFRNP